MCSSPWGMRFKMKRRVIFSILFAVISSTNFVPDGLCEIVDKIVAVVNGRIITLSDIRKEHQIQLALDDPAETDDEVLHSLIDRYLLEEEMSQYPGLDVSDDELDPLMKGIIDTHGLSLKDIREANIRKIQRQKYLYSRFGQFIVISNEEIEKFYNDQFVPEAKRRGVTPPELSQVTMQIRQNLLQEKLSQELEDSLKDLRTRSTTNIEILK
jgi:parvulin-like peptidyl-prolyl isomerase